MPEEKEKYKNLNFNWVFTGKEEIEDEKRYREFLKKMYSTKISSALIIKKEEKFLKNINE